MDRWNKPGKIRWLAGGLATAGLALAAFLLWRHLSDSLVLNDVTADTGVTFVHTDGSCGQRYIMETVSAGLALFDYDGDGAIDVYFLNGAPLAGCERESLPRNALYRSDGAWNFVDVTEEAGVGDTGYGLGAAVADYDNDGHADIFVNNFGPNVLYRNNGDGTFTDVTEQAELIGDNLDEDNRVGAGACFLDIDRDGDLDLYVANYLEFSYAEHATTTIRGIPAYVSPQRYQPAQDHLYRNNGDGTFTEISQEAGIGGVRGWGMGVVCADYDNDGDTDVFTANDVSENFVFENDGTGKFEEVGLVAGAAYDVYGSPQGSMGVDCGDFDNDGLLDFYQTSFQLQHAVLFRNSGDGVFEDVTLASGAGAGTYAHVTWGNSFVDFDNDGDRDIFVACGHLHDRVEEFDTTTLYSVQNLLLMNTGDGHFTNISEQCGDGLLVKRSSRGAAFDDLDNDGDIDVVIVNSRREPTILRNDTKNAQHWIQVQLKSARSNRDGVGAHVRVVAGGLNQMDEVHSGRGYQSHYGSRLHFGLGNHRTVDRVEVHWIGGGVDVLEDVDADQLITILEGTSGGNSDLQTNDARGR